MNRIDSLRSNILELIDEMYEELGDDMDEADRDEDDEAADGIQKEMNLVADIRWAVRNA